mmetsp:Transcript_3140/g.4818  ORF Transcript_3140/g.4818 Transcript_3140/m.4818 type:complete len:253 (-) Transcript_3140:137-895(-)
MTMALVVVAAAVASLTMSTREQKERSGRSVLKQLTISRKKCGGVRGTTDRRRLEQRPESGGRRGIDTRSRRSTRRHGVGNEQIGEGRGVVRSRSRHAHGGIVERLATKRTTDQTPRIGIGGGGRTLRHSISQLSLRTNGVCGSQVGVETPHRGAYQSRWTCRQIDDESNLHAKHGKARYVGTDGDRGGHVRRDGNRGWEGGGGGGIEVADGGWEDWRDTREGVGFEYEGDCERDEGGLCGECGGLGKCVGGV